LRRARISQRGFIVAGNKADNFNSRRDALDLYFDLCHIFLGNLRRIELRVVLLFGGFSHSMLRGSVIVMVLLTRDRAKIPLVMAHAVVVGRESLEFHQRQR